jgi:hypothetical protein
MNERHTRDHATSGHSQPIDPAAREPQDDGAPARPSGGGNTDAGRTSGGGSLGHVQPDKVTREAPLRNNAEKRDSDEPTLPSNDATLNTKI